MAKITDEEAIKKMKDPSVLTKLKELFSKVEAKFLDVTLKDGSLLKVSGDILEPKAAVSIGEDIAPDGDYILEDGSIIVVMGGVIDSIKDPAAATEDPTKLGAEDPIAKMEVRIKALEDALGSTATEMIAAMKLIEKQREELKAQHEISKETFKILESFVALPASGSTEAKPKVDEKFDKVEALMETLKTLKKK